MPWLAVLLVTLWADSATTAQRPMVLGLFFLTLGLAVWCSWADDKRKRPPR